MTIKIAMRFTADIPFQMSSMLPFSTQSNVTCWNKKYAKAQRKTKTHDLAFFVRQKPLSLGKRSSGTLGAWASRSWRATIMPFRFRMQPILYFLQDNSNAARRNKHNTPKFKTWLRGKLNDLEMPLSMVLRFHAVLRTWTPKRTRQTWGRLQWNYRPRFCRCNRCLPFPGRTTQLVVTQSRTRRKLRHFTHAGKPRENPKCSYFSW